MESHRNQISTQSVTSKGKGAIKRHKQNISKSKPPQLRAVLKPPVETCADRVIRPQPVVNLPPPNLYDITVYWLRKWADLTFIVSIYQAHPRPCLRVQTGG